MGFELPKRCIDCRKVRKDAKKAGKGQSVTCIDCNGNKRIV